MIMIEHVGGIPIAAEPDSALTAAIKNRIAANMDVQRLRRCLERATLDEHANAVARLAAAQERERNAQNHVNMLRAKKNSGK